MRILSYYLIGLVFGLGISISGMSNPAKVLNFFDIAGNWDPSLALVMCAALVTSFMGYRLIFKTATPMLAASFSLPKNQKIDLKLILGAVIFGIGWGIAGFCPGGALPAIGNGSMQIFQFVAPLSVGIILSRLALRKFSTSS